MRFLLDMNLPPAVFPPLGRSLIVPAMDYRDRIVIDPEIRFGIPCLRGTRMTVGDVRSYLASGMTEQQILAILPN